ncbi:LysR substrate-binding domain-containing protein [Chelativorans intermedius]|uniref:LysR substrate-binding domain-containing protein n=1 Tax=Chelativorans intermedius TaxID=515947 RepID=A0ABV6D9A9_9HYPH|nr:LysR substrate-binding domain-containing protein [Chelativorans intermedius]MCT8999955.1 LysR substrate-binding domain-containing protein [Chelativorans intermedius]
MRNLNRVHLNALRAVEAVLRLGSLAAAAEELGVSVGAVSQHVLRCERQLGQAVFERTRKGLVPTAFGRRIAGWLSEGFGRLDEAVALSRRHADTVLTISAAPVLAAKWLVPRLSRFSARHPELRLRLDASVALVNPDASDIDLAFRVGKGGWPGVRAERVLDLAVFPVCAPALCERLKTPRDLLRAPIVRDANSNLSWDLWLASHGMSENDLPEGDSFTDAALALDAAIAGQGVLLAWPFLAHDALSAGLLVRPFRELAETAFSYWMVTSQNRPEPQKVKDFKAWIREETADIAAQYKL